MVRTPRLFLWPLVVAPLLAAPAHAQLFLVEPPTSGGPASPEEAGIGQQLPGANIQEKQENFVWAMRAGLNVAALQCQFSPYLQTVPNYNDILRHHSVELEKARKGLAAYFNRTKGKGRAGTIAFDQYTTRTYNGFSTLYGQLNFCNTAAKIGRAALGVEKGKFTAFSLEKIRALTSSLTPVGEGFFRVNYAYLPMEALVDPCLDKRGRRVKRCK